MSIHSDAQVRLILCDFANTDAAGKLNVIGGGISFMGSGPQGQTSPFSVAVIVNVPSKYSGQQFVLSLELFDETRKQVVQAPATSGAAEALRVQQMVTLAHIQLPAHVQTPPDAEVQHVMVMNFPAGLPLQPSTYDWKVQIDAQSRPGWYSRFHVLGPAPGPIFGGPTGPSDITGIAQPFAAPKDEPEPPQS